VYRLLLWIDRTTGLAHCYESDKSQPGRPWYARSLVFHDWVSGALAVAPSALAERIDWLFKRATEDLAASTKGEEERAAVAARSQRAPYEGRGFPEPGTDPELVSIIREVVGSYFREPPPDAVWRELTERVTAYLTQENKRKNLVGEGFEDVLREIVTRVPCARSLSGIARVAIGAVPGFNAPQKGKKAKKVDLLVTDTTTGHRTLVTAKWSVRADREEQFQTDFGEYAMLENSGAPWSYVLVTNEYDAARLLAACDARRVGNQPLFTRVVHVNPNGILAAYGNDPQRSAKVVAERIQAHRLVSLSHWLGELSGGAA
jgi:hypothetical protein